MLLSKLFYQFSFSLFECFSVKGSYVPKQRDFVEFKMSLLPKNEESRITEVQLLDLPTDVHHGSGEKDVQLLHSAAAGVNHE
jgi:hypothetical protein